MHGPDRHFRRPVHIVSDLQNTTIIITHYGEIYDWKPLKRKVSKVN